MNENIILDLSNPNKEQLVNAHIAAKILGLSVRTVQDKASRRELPVYKIGRAVRFRVGDLLEWREEKRIEPLVH